MRDNIDDESLKKRIKVEDFRRAYMVFETLTDHPFSFSCNLCGPFPSTLITDVCRKCYYGLSVTQKASVEDGSRNIGKFWSDVQISVLSKSGQKSLIKDCAPWICPQNRLETMESTEGSKGQCDSISFEENCMISDGELEELLFKKTKAEVKEILKSLNISFKESASRHQLIADLLKEIYINDAFHKQFKAAHGGSGGYLAYLCTHGVVYALTPLIKHESPSDYIDVFLSFKIKPHFVISDLPGNVSKNLFNRKKEYLRKHLGMLLAPTIENIERAKRGEITLDMTTLMQPEEDCFDLADDNEKKSYFLYDNLHKHNTKKDSEVLRHTNLVEGLRSINTQAAEQLNSKIGRMLYFLDRMNFGNHLLYLRLCIELINLEINETNRMKCEQRFKTYKIDLTDSGSLDVIHEKNGGDSTSEYHLSDEQESDYDLEASDPLENALASLLQNCVLDKEVTQAYAVQESQLTEFVQSRENIESFVQNPVEIPQTPERYQTSERLSVEVAQSITSEETLETVEADFELSDIAHQINSLPQDHCHDQSVTIDSQKNVSLKEADVSSLMAVQYPPTAMMNMSVTRSHEPVCSPSNLMKQPNDNEVCVQRRAPDCDVTNSIIKTNELQFNSIERVDVLTKLLNDKKLSNYLMYEIRTCKIFVEDLVSLAHGKEVTDGIIDGVLSLFSEAQTDISCLCTAQVTIALKLKSSNFKHGSRLTLMPWCTNSHWRLIVLYTKEKEWTIMDPLGTKETDVNLIENKFVKSYLNVSLSRKWTYRDQVPYDLQKDSSSCGVFILKYAYELVFNSKPKLPVNNLRNFFSELIFDCKKTSEDFCARCNTKKGGQWIQCSSCSRWLHVQCTSLDVRANYDDVDFVCAVCEAVDTFHQALGELSRFCEHDFCSNN